MSKCWDGEGRATMRKRRRTSVGCVETVWGVWRRCGVCGDGKGCEGGVMTVRRDV